jgi:uncharacterized membrane protein HdeD (DUF308 family)
MNEAMIRERLPKIWVNVLLRGLVPIMLGAAMIFMPNKPPMFYTFIFGAYVLIDGILLLIQTFILGKADIKRWSRILHGTIGVLVGLAVFLVPEISNTRLVTLFSGYEIVTGILQALTALDLRRTSEYADLIALGGVMSIVVGGLLSVQPLDTLSDLVRVIGIFLLIYGMILVALALRFKNVKRYANNI